MSNEKRNIKVKNRNTSFRTHKAKAGDSYISIANSYTDDNGHIRKRKEGELPLNYEDLVYYAGYTPGKEPALVKGTKVLLEDPYILNAAVKTTKAPEDLSEYSYVPTPDITKEDTKTIYAGRSSWPEKPISGQQLIRQYAAGIENGSITSKNVPEYLRTAVMQSLMTNSNFHNQLASRFSHGINAVIAPEAELAWYLGTKGAAAINDKASGRNEYTAKQLINPFEWTPMTGTAYASEHPGTELALQAAVAGMPSAVNAVSEIAPAVQAAAQNAGIYMKNAANDLAYGAVAGTKPQVNTVMKATMPHNPNRFQGYGSTKMNGQYLKLVDKPVTRPTPIPVPTPKTTIVSTPGALNTKQFMVPMEFPYMSYTPPKIDPKNSIFEQYSISNWQLPNPGSTVIPVTGPASKVYSGYAIPGASELQQPIVYKVNIENGTAPRVSSYSTETINPYTDFTTHPGEIFMGYSGLGHRYGEGTSTPLPSGIIFKKGGILKRK